MKEKRNILLISMGLIILIGSCAKSIQVSHLEDGSKRVEVSHPDKTRARYLAIKRADKFCSSSAQKALIKSENIEFQGTFDEKTTEVARTVGNIGWALGGKSGDAASDAARGATADAKYIAKIIFNCGP